jgi:hypothetical protein
LIENAGWLLERGAKNRHLRSACESLATVNPTMSGFEKSSLSCSNFAQCVKLEGIADRSNARVEWSRQMEKEPIKHDLTGPVFW